MILRPIDSQGCDHNGKSWPAKVGLLTLRSGHERVRIMS